MLERVLNAPLLRLYTSTLKFTCLESRKFYSLGGIMFGNLLNLFDNYSNSKCLKTITVQN